MSNLEKKIHSSIMLDIACNALRQAIKNELVVHDYSKAWHDMAMRSTAKDRLVKQFYAQRG